LGGGGATGEGKARRLTGGIPRRSEVILQRDSESRGGFTHEEILPRNGNKKTAGPSRSEGKCSIHWGAPGEHVIAKRKRPQKGNVPSLKEREEQ